MLLQCVLYITLYWYSHDAHDKIQLLSTLAICTCEPTEHPFLLGTSQGRRELCDPQIQKQETVAFSV